MLASILVHDLALSTLVDAVPPDRIDEHGTRLKNLGASLWEITLPTGYRASRQKKGFWLSSARSTQADIEYYPNQPRSQAGSSGKHPNMANGKNMTGRNQSPNPLVRHRRKKYLPQWEKKGKNYG